MALVTTRKDGIKKDKAKEKRKTKRHQYEGVLISP
jgi:hypothetical protein